MLTYFQCAALTTFSAWISLAFSLKAYRLAKTVKGDTFINAQYALVRSFALAFFSLIPFLIESSDMLILMALLMITVQGFDAVISSKTKHHFRTIGSVLIAVGNAVLLMLFVG
jgi:hypothetical protein